MKSLLTSLKVSNPGHLLLDFDYHEYPERQTVKQKYPRERFAPAYANYVIVGKIVLTGEDLVVPPEYGDCTLGRGSEPARKPEANHTNHPSIEVLLNGPASKES